MNTKKFVLHTVLSLLAIFTLLFGLTGPAPVYASSNVQSVLVQAATAADAASLVERFGGTVTSHLQIINGVAADLPERQIAALRSMPGVAVTENATTVLSSQGFDDIDCKKPKKDKGKPTTDYPDVIGADMVWAEGVTGHGVSVAILDTGIAMHPDLIDSPGQGHGNGNGHGKPRKKEIGWVDFVQGKKKPVDPNGHGTHVAGIIANSSIGADGEWNGVAPGVNLVGVRVLDETGAGNYETVIKGIQWVIANKDRYNIKVMNLSLHALVQSPYWADPLNQAVMQAWANGITVVVAAGNTGPNPMSISVPGNNPYVITVGAFTDNYTPYDWNDDYLAEFSAAGPTLDGFVKPDLLAPGAHILSTMMKNSYIARGHEGNWVHGQYFSMAGTSQAAAVTSGAAALVIDANESLSPDQVKYRLMITSLPWINAEQTDVLYSVWQQGFGRLNAYDAVTANINGYANRNMDIQADLAGVQHYEGHSYFDPETGTFRIHGYEDMTSGFGAWAGGFGARAGGCGAWADGIGAWADGFGAWADGFGAWADGFGAWAGGFGAWAGGFGAWAGGFGAWADGFGAWADGFGAWADGFGAWAGSLTDPEFVAKFLAGVSPNARTTTGSLNWVGEP